MMPEHHRSGPHSQVGTAQRYPYIAFPSIAGRCVGCFRLLVDQAGYQFFIRQCYILRCTAIEGFFRRRRLRSLATLTPEKLQQCRLFFHHRPGEISTVVGCLHRFLLSERRIPQRVPPAAKPYDAILAAYKQYLTDVRGLASVYLAPPAHRPRVCHGAPAERAESATSPAMQSLSRVREIPS
jgi:hypothetical protein